MRIKGIIFDLDGVLVSTDDLHYLAWKKIATQEEIPFDKEMNHQLRGVSRMDSLDFILKNSDKIYTKQEKLELARIKNDYYIELLKDLSKKDLLPNAEFILRYLKQKKYKLAIGSSSRNAKAILSKLDISHFFDVIVDGTHITNSKPDPEVFTLAGKQMGLSPDECCVIEDSSAGIIAANDAKMISIGYGQATNDDEAQYKINDLLDLQKYM